MKTLTASLIICLSPICLAFDETRQENNLTTRTVKYGKDKEILVVIKRHPKEVITLELDKGEGEETIKEDIQPGNGNFEKRYQVQKRWSAEIFLGGSSIDREAATRKTGLTRVN